MADKAILEIIEISKKQAESKFKPGEMYWQVSVTDGKTGRKATVFGDWGKDWKLGDTIEVMWEPKAPYQGKEQWGLKDPNAAPKKPWTGGQGGGSSTPMIVHAYMIAATSLGAFFKNKEQIKVTDLTALADKILPLIQTAAPAPAAQTPAAPAPAAPAPVVAPTPAPAPVAAVNTTPKVDGDWDPDDDTPF